RRHGIPLVHERAGVGRGLQDHPKVAYRFELGHQALTAGTPWYQVLLTGEVEVGAERRLYQVMPYAGTERAGHGFVELNLTPADARSRRGEVRLQSRDPRAQPAIDMGWLCEGGDHEATLAAG